MAKRLFGSMLILLLLPFLTRAQAIAINNFLVKENLLKNDKIAIIAADSAGRPLENINGTFLFVINGFKQELKFNDGVAVAPQQIEKSTFIYIKHQNSNGTHAGLYYVVKKDDNLNPVKINWYLLVLIPLIIIILAGMFRKFIVFALILLAVFLFFNHSKGLSIPTWFETVIDGLKSVF